MSRSPTGVLRLTALTCLLWVSGCVPTGSEEALGGIDGRAIEAHVRFLASDLLEGREPGTRGADLAALYVATVFQAAGLRPAVGDTSYLQPVPLIASVSTPELRLRARGGAESRPEPGSEYVLWSPGPADTIRVQGEVIFAGYGLSEPGGRDDYKDAGVDGAVLLLLAGGPMPTGARAGDAYYRTAHRKFEEAIERGARVVFLIHDPQASGVSWDALRSAWSGERAVLEGAGTEPRPAGLGWMTREAAGQLAEMVGLDLEGLIEGARAAEFRPLRLGINATVEVRNDSRRVRGTNVVGLLPGRDRQGDDEAVIVTAHFDHLGIGADPGGDTISADSIYNGAYDNASGTALLLALAEAFGRMPDPVDRPILFLASTAGESENAGVRHYLDAPLHPLNRTRAAVVIEGANVWGRTREIAAAGHSWSSIGEVLSRAAQAEGLRLDDDRRGIGWALGSELSLLLRTGVPTVLIGHGLDYLARPEGWGVETWGGYLRTRYHQPGDEYETGLDFGGAVQQARVAFRVVQALAEEKTPPAFIQPPDWVNASGPR